MKISFYIFVLLFTFSGQINGQENPFDVLLEPIEFAELGGLQSFAFGKHEGKWLLVGGRLDGLHRRQPWASFDAQGQNNLLTVIDPITREKWTASISSLPLLIREQLSATNMEFIEEGDYLYLLGGYGYSASLDDHITHPKLTAIALPGLIEAIIAGQNIEPYFRQTSDEQFAVTGGYLNKIEDTFYLTGGHRFDGRYNPMNHPTFTQEYTNAIRKFTLQDDGTNITITHLPTIVDPALFHRRDLNVVEQIMPDGAEGLTVFSGVFQLTEDLPFLNAVNITDAAYAVQDNFTQYYNHYHCAQVAIFSAVNNKMHTVFFGGIAQYYEENGTLVQDNDVPFVKTIARVTRSADGSMKEYKLPVEMPTLLGAGAEFILADDLPLYDNGVLQLDELTEDSTFIGYIFGGIASSAPNIFWTNNGTQSAASSQLFKVHLLKNTTTAAHILNQNSVSSIQLEVYPNPNLGTFLVRFDLTETSKAVISIFDASGQRISFSTWGDLTPGTHAFHQEIKNLTHSGIYFITLETPHEKVTRKIILNL